MIVAILRFILARMMGEPLFKAFLARMEGKMWEPLKRWFAMGERARAKVDPVKIVEGMSSKAIGQFNKFTRIFAESNLLQTLYHHLPGSIKKSVANVQELQRLLQGAKIQSIIDQSPDSPQGTAPAAGSNNGEQQRPVLQVNRWINVVSAAVQKSMFIPVSKSTVDSRQREWLIGLVVVHFWNGKINYDYYDHPYSAGAYWCDGIRKNGDGFWSRMNHDTYKERRGHAAFRRLRPSAILHNYVGMARQVQGMYKHLRPMMPISAMPAMKGMTPTAAQVKRYGHFLK